MLYKLSESAKKGYAERAEKATLKQAGWREKHLENFIANNISEIVSSEHLMTFFTEHPGEVPDILALDEKGDLYIFELKRWEGKQDRKGGMKNKSRKKATSSPRVSISPQVGKME